MKHSIAAAALAAAVVLAGCAGTTQAPAAQSMSGEDNHLLLVPGDLKWVDAPPSLPPGAKVALMEGDPQRPGPFTMRFKLPPNYRVSPHWHPADEHVTVISGTFYMGLGDTFNEAAGKALTTGGFGMMKAGVRHFAWTQVETVIQVHAIGPWALNYVNPADDPRNKK